MNSFTKYFSDIFTAVGNLLGGMNVTMKEFWTKKVTMEYPENRETLVISDRWRAELRMPHDENNEHACTSCGLCMTNCPNGTIKVISKIEVNDEGKKKKLLDKHIWDAGMCTYCNLCVISCPSDAIKFDNDFEQAVFNRDMLVHKLNQEGSKLREKKKVVRPKPTTDKAKTTDAPKDESKPKVEVKSADTKQVEPKEVEKKEETDTTKE